MGGGLEYTCLSHFQICKHLEHNGMQLSVTPAGRSPHSPEVQLLRSSQPHLQGLEIPLSGVRGKWVRFKAALMHIFPPPPPPPTSCTHAMPTHPPFPTLFPPPPPPPPPPPLVPELHLLAVQEYQLDQIGLLNQAHPRMREEELFSTCGWVQVKLYPMNIRTTLPVTPSKPRRPDVPGVPCVQRTLTCIAAQYVYP